MIRAGPNGLVRSNWACLVVLYTSVMSRWNCVVSTAVLAASRLRLPAADTYCNVETSEFGERFRKAVTSKPEALCYFGSTKQLYA